MHTKTNNIEELKRAIYSERLGVRCRFDDLYNSIEDCIADLRNIQIFDEMWFARRHVKGYAYIISFNKRLNQGKDLTPKQKTQLKRIAKAVVKANLILQGVRV